MAFENLFITTKKSIGGILLDAVLSESHSNSVSVSNNPIELGADITDHAIVQPKKINILAEVTDNPLGLAAFGQLLDTVTGLFGTSTTTNLTRSNAAYNALVQLMDSRALLEVQTKLKLYSNMMITDISIVQDKDSSRIARMNISLTEVRIVESQLITLNPDQLEDGTTKDQASPTENSNQDAKVPTEPTNKSVLKSVYDWIVQ